MLPDRSSTSLLADMAQVIQRDDVAAFGRIVAMDGMTPQRLAAGLRIHASTTYQTLTRALADAVPTAAAMLTSDAFSDLARDFIGNHPPGHAALHDWGDKLPAFLAMRAAPSDLIAMAQLDRAWMASFFAADAEPIGADCLTSLKPSEIPHARLTVHPSVRLVRLTGSWLEAWLARAALPQIQHEPDAAGDGCLVLLSRPQARVRVAAVTPSAYRFLAALLNGSSLLAASEAALSEDSQFDLQARLSAGFADGLFIDCQAGELES
jgi:hypothetical protein